MKTIILTEKELSDLKAEMKTIKGHPHASIDYLCEQYDRSPQTIKDRLREIETMSGPGKRYPENSVKRLKNNLQGCDYTVFWDYMTYHDDLCEPNIAKKMAPYNPYTVGRRLGWYQEEA